MNIAKLKLEIIPKIIATNNSVLLERIKEIIDYYDTNLAVNEPPIVYKNSTSQTIILNEWQQKRIDIALKQIKNGEYLTEEEEDKEMQKWFKEEEKLFGQ